MHVQPERFARRQTSAQRQCVAIMQMTAPLLQAGVQRHVTLMTHKHMRTSAFITQKLDMACSSLRNKTEQLEVRRVQSTHITWHRETAVHTAVDTSAPPRHRQRLILPVILGLFDVRIRVHLADAGFAVGTAPCLLKALRHLREVALRERHRRRRAVPEARNVCHSLGRLAALLPSQDTTERALYAERR